MSKDKPPEIDPNYYNKIAQFTGSKPPIVVASMDALLTVCCVPKGAMPLVKDLIERFIRSERERCIEIVEYGAGDSTAWLKEKIESGECLSK